MNIFIRISGPITDGLDSPTRGEGRWGFNIARILANDGHKIVMSEDGGCCKWGSGKKHPNIEIIPWNRLDTLSEFEFDAYMTVCFELKPKPIKAKRYLVGVYSLGSLGEEPLISKVQKNEYILAPGRSAHIIYRDALYKKNAEWKDRYKLLCQPYGKEFGKSKFDRKTILFTAKDVFHKSNRHLYEDGMKSLLAAIDACKETGSKLVMTSTAWNHSDHKETIKELRIVERLRELNDVRILPIIPWSDLMHELSMGSIFIPLQFAGCTPDAIFSGLVPLLRKNPMLLQHPDVDSDSLVKEMGDSSVQSQDEIKKTLIRLLTDEDFYNHFQRELQKVMIDHLDENVLKQFYDIIEYDERREK